MGDWSRQYIAESIKREELDPWRDDPGFFWLQWVAVQCPRIVGHARTLALEAGDTHGAAVAESVLGAAYGAYRRGTNIAPKISQKQGFVVARILAERHGSARGVAAALYGLTDEEIDNADG